MASYLEWNRSIVSALFPVSDSEAPVYLQLDDVRLQDIARISSLELGGDASSDLATAVRGRFVANDRVTMPEIAAPSAGDAPMQIGFLALTVLAASRMDVGADPGGHVASTNYYTRLNALLGLTADGCPPGWDNPVFEALWLELKDRLANECRGTLAVAPGRATRRYVWLPVSQSLLPKADIRKLSDFFSRHDLPIYCPTSRELPEFDSTFVGWARTSSLSARTKAILALASPRRTELLAQVRLALVAWDGSTPTARHADDETPRAHVAPVDVRLDLSETGEHYYSWLIHRPATFPSQLPMAGGNLALPPLVATNADAMYYDPISLPTNYDVGAPVSLQAIVGADTYSFVRGPEDVIVFHRDSYLFNSWLSVRRLIHGRDARIVCRVSIADRVRALLHTLGNTQPVRHNLGEASLGDGWHLFSDFRSKQSEVDVYDERLACLIPDATARLSLVGGIQLRRPGRRHIYLRGYGPTLAETESSEKVLLNGAPFEAGARPLSNLPLGAYELTRGTRRVAFSIVDPSISAIPARFSTFALPGNAPSSARVSGASVECSALDDTTWTALADMQLAASHRAPSPSARTYHGAQLERLRPEKVLSHHRGQLSILGAHLPPIGNP